ncbi:MAG TPA: WecB/TagA/CpsF family glycosyltransferase, partial [Ktedonobacterales bacterium]|nr:WecB/TagA/CpsF family glycosyltransferase [Ktedonobacterales bacterium]
MSVHSSNAPDHLKETAAGLTKPPRILLLGLPIDCVNLDAALDVLSARIESQRISGADALRRTAQVITLNPEILMRARTLPGLRALIEAADLVVADGVGILWTAWMLATPLPGRVTGVDLVQGLAQRAVERGYRLFLLGAAPGVAKEAASQLERDFPGLRIAGIFSGTPQRAGDEEAVARIRAVNADVVLVAYGSPAQEYWIASNIENAGVRFALGVGGSFDHISGLARRAPLWMQRMGFEWLYRLLREPHRL